MWCRPARWRSGPAPRSPPRHRDGKLYGRGAADMKTSLAALVVAVEEFVAAQPQAAARHRLPADQRRGRPGGGRHRGGLRARCKARGEVLDYCIVGEPTSVRAHRRHDQERPARHHERQAHRQGRAGPHRLPAPGQQPDPPVRPGAGRAGRRSNGTRATHFFPPTTWQVSNIHGGTGASNVIPGAVVIDFNFRFSTESTPESLQQPPDTRCCDKHELDYDLAWTLGGLPFLTTPGHAGGRGARRHPRRDRHRDRALHHRRHQRRPLHRADLPAGDRVRPAQRHHPQDRRTRAGGRHRAAEEHLPPRAGKPGRHVQRRAADDRHRR